MRKIDAALGTRAPAPAREGSVLLDGALISKMPTRTVATRLGLLPQHPVAPDGITVAELVQRGRHPHHRWGSRTRDDDEIVADALERTHTAAFATRPVDSLSGDQRQRVWIAMALAQQTPLMLLDEPTSYLDMAHQIDILDLLTDLNRDGATIVAVLYGLNQAAAYSDTLVAMKDGAIVATGRPHNLVNEAFVEQVFGLRARVIRDPDTDASLVLARSRRDLPTTGA